MLGGPDHPPGVNSEAGPASLLSAAPRAERRTFRHGMFEVPLEWSGGGRPLLFLHGAWGLLSEWQPDGSLARLAEHHLVLTPRHPGFDGATGIENLDDSLDLALYYLDFLDELLIDSPYVVGQGLGAMIAAEMAALAPQRIAKLVLAAPYGLWLEDTPLADIFALQPDELEAYLWHESEVSMPSDGDPEAVHQRSQNLAAAAKFLGPLPEKGLRKRLHRLVAPTLLIWGQRDRIIPPIYGQAFHERIAHSRVEIIPDAGHLAHLEQPDAFARMVLEFLEG
jgi:pimeloyl-ACP methyl ester carboxylesterase